MELDAVFERGRTGAAQVIQVHLAPLRDQFRIEMGLRIYSGASFTGSPDQVEFEDWEPREPQIMYSNMSPAPSPGAPLSLPFIGSAVLLNP